LKGWLGLAADSCAARADACSSRRTDSLANVGLDIAECIFVSLQGHPESGQQALRREVIHDDPLRNFDGRLSRRVRMRVEAEIENQFFGRARNAAKIGVPRRTGRVVDVDHRLRGSFARSGRDWSVSIILCHGWFPIGMQFRSKFDCSKTKCDWSARLELADDAPRL
jgi:hypothetical protein